MTGSGVRQVFYGVAALIGLVLSWYFNLRYFAAAGSDGLAGYVVDWFTNDASSAVAVDVIVVAVVASVLMLTESRRVGIRPPIALACVLAGFLVALSFAFPLFLLLRERQLVAMQHRSLSAREAK